MQPSSPRSYSELQQLLRMRSRRYNSSEQVRDRRDPETKCAHASEDVEPDFTACAAPSRKAELASKPSLPFSCRLQKQGPGPGDLLCDSCPVSSPPGCRQPSLQPLFVPPLRFPPRCSHVAALCIQAEQVSGLPRARLGSGGLS